MKKKKRKKKRRRPRQHWRRIKTKKGYKRILVNKDIRPRKKVKRRKYNKASNEFYEKYYGAPARVMLPLIIKFNDALDKQAKEEGGMNQNIIPKGDAKRYLGEIQSFKDKKKMKIKRYPTSKYKYVRGVIKNKRSENIAIASEIGRYKARRDLAKTKSERMRNQIQIDKLKKELAENSIDIDMLNKKFFPKNPS
jgi:hypothetical protein